MASELGRDVAGLLVLLDSMAPIVWEEAKMHVRVVVPVLHSLRLAGKAHNEYRNAASAGTFISTAALDNGTRTIESDFDVSLAAPETIALIQQAEQDGADACTVACFSDPGVAGARKTVNIPVIGEGQAALVFASLLGHRFCVVTTWNQCIPRVRRIIARNNMAPQLATVIAVNRGVLDLNESSVQEIAIKTAEAVCQHGADVVIMACTGTGLNMAASVQQSLGGFLGQPVPVIDPVKAAITLAEACITTGTARSKVAWPRPGRRPEQNSRCSVGSAR